MADEGGIRVEFEDFVVDPRNPDHAYRALDVAADLVTFEDGHAVFWCEGVEEVRFPVSAIRALAPRVPAVGTMAAGAGAKTGAGTGAGTGNGAGRADEAAAQVAYVAEVRRKHPKAYTAWSADDEARLAELFRAGRSVEELMAEFGRQRGGIMSRLEKLGLRSGSGSGSGGAGAGASTEGSLPAQSRGGGRAAASTAETAAKAAEAAEAGEAGEAADRWTRPRTPTAADARQWPEPPF